jgi:DNA-binding XRE family transcriptional regulator
MMNNKEFIEIRNFLCKTQVQLSELLSVSHKAVQSYEQGWRNIPSYVERQMLLLLALRGANDKNNKPCWELKNCQKENRNKCIVWEFKVRHFCWFLNGTYCQGKTQKRWENKMKLCRECEVYKNMLSKV